MLKNGLFLVRVEKFMDRYGNMVAVSVRFASQWKALKEAWLPSGDRAHIGSRARVRRILLGIVTAVMMVPMNEVLPRSRSSTPRRSPCSARNMVRSLMERPTVAAKRMGKTVGICLQH